MSTSAQLLKAYGHLPTIGLDNLADERAVHAAGMVDADVLAGRFCGCPDFPDAELAEANVDSMARQLDMQRDEAGYLQRAHASMLEAATGRGSFPAACHPDVDDARHVVKYHVLRETFNSNWLRKCSEAEIRHVAGAGVWNVTAEQLLDLWLGKPLLDAGLWLLEETYRRVGARHVATDKKSEANIVMRCRYISGGTIGIGWFNSGSCSSSVESHYDSSWQPSLARCSLLLNHEVGHNNNLQHEFTNQGSHHGVMSYSWPNNTYGFLKGTEGILPRDPSWGPLTRYYGGDPFPPGPQPPPPMKDLPGSLWAQEYAPGRIAIRGQIDLPAGFKVDAATSFVAYPKSEGASQYVLRTPPPA